MSFPDLDLAAIDATLDEVRAHVDHGEAPHNSQALQALRAAEQLRAALGPAFAVIRPNALPEATRRQRVDQDDLGPSPAQLGDTLTVTPGEWTPLDDEGTQIYLYGDQPADLAVQTAPAADEVRQLRDEVDRLRQRIDVAHERLAIDEFDPDSCPDLESTIEYAISRYRELRKAEAEASDRVQDLRIQLDRIRKEHLG